MKRCLSCKAVSPDDETTCGVCGASLAEAPFESIDQIDREQIEDARLERQAEAVAIRQIEMKRLKVKIAVTAAGVLIAVGCVAFALFLFGQNRNSYGYYALIVGFVVLWITLVPAKYFGYGRWGGSYRGTWRR